MLERKINGHKVEVHRQRKGLSQRQLGERVGATQGGINSLEHEYKSPNKVYRSTSVEKFVRIGEELAVSLDYLADRTDDPRPVEDLLAALAASSNSAYSAALLMWADELGLSLDELVEYLSDPRTLEVLAVDADNLVWASATDAEQRATLQGLLDGAQKLSQHELRMVQLLVRRLWETAKWQAAMPEATEAARIIEHLPPGDREEAMQSLHDIENKTISELQKRMNYLMEVVKDLGFDAETLVRDRFGDRFDLARK